MDSGDRSQRRRQRDLDGRETDNIIRIYAQRALAAASKSLGEAPKSRLTWFTTSSKAGFLTGRYPSFLSTLAWHGSRGIIID